MEHSLPLDTLLAAMDELRQGVNRAFYLALTGWFKRR